MSWRMDRNKSWLGGRLFNMAPPRLAAPTQCKARPQDGRPNAIQGLSASWAPQRNARHVCKLGAPTHFRNANAWHVRTSATQMHGTSARPQVGRPNATKGASARCMPKRNVRCVRKMGAQTKNRSATKTSTQGSTRLKNELEDG
jgi:hypothetical protein